MHLRWSPFLRLPFVSSWDRTVPEYNAEGLALVDLSNVATVLSVEDATVGQYCLYLLHYNANNGYPPKQVWVLVCL